MNHILDISCDIGAIHESPSYLGHQVPARELFFIVACYIRIKHSSTLQKKHSEPSKTPRCKIYYHISTRHNIESGG